MFLTKSKFKIALECPAKLYYHQHRDQYANSKLEDSFLAALAEGGFQVGELAKLYFPGGVDIETLDYDAALAQTRELMGRERCVVYEAAFQFEGLFVRADVVVKDGNRLDLYEVKAKSIKAGEEESFVGKKGGISSKWKPYLMDVAFQKWVAMREYPELNIRSHLMLADKSVEASVDGLNQLFFLEEREGRKRVRVNKAAYDMDLGRRVLRAVNTDDVVAEIHSGRLAGDFGAMVSTYAGALREDRKLAGELGGACAKCEFRTEADPTDTGLRSGFHQCWRELAGLRDADFARPLVVDIWRTTKKRALIEAGKYFQAEVTRDDLAPTNTKKHTEPGLSTLDRQEMQVKKVRLEDNEPYIDVAGLRAVMGAVRYPLHFIDFETTSVAIPFHADRRPYETIAFQFSHHVLEEDGSLRHAGEWIDTAQGSFPNFRFIRALQKELGGDIGTIFRYSNHENTVLNAIYEQLGHSTEPDSAELMAFIQTITHSKSDRADQWTGDRDMVDLWDWVKRYYYHPATGGANSIKYVLPALLGSSAFLQEKYGKPVYGTETIPSKNFRAHTWLHQDENGQLVNPYKTLPRIHAGYDNEALDDLVTGEDGEIQDGGAALVAYARMQFTEMSGEERQRIRQALLRYCELDTLAMVMIWEGWREAISI